MHLLAAVVRASSYSMAPPNKLSATALINTQGILFLLAVRTIPADSISHMSALYISCNDCFLSTSATNLSAEAHITFVSVGSTVIAVSNNDLFVGKYTDG